MILFATNFIFLPSMFVYILIYTCVVVTVVSYSYTLCGCDVEFGCWVCGESWVAIKYSLTHRPSSQGWAPSVLLSCHVMCICVMDIFGFVDICWVVVENNKEVLEASQTV